MGKGVGEEAIFCLCFLMWDRRFFSSRRKEAKADRGPRLHKGVAAPAPTPWRMSLAVLASQGRFQRVLGFRALGDRLG